MKDDRALIYIGVAIAAIVALGLLVTMEKWVEWAPGLLRWHVGVLVLGLCLGSFLWLRRPPSLGSGGTRRRRRLRDRYRDPDAD